MKVFRMRRKVMKSPIVDCETRKKIERLTSKELIEDCSVLNLSRYASIFIENTNYKRSHEISNSIDGISKTPLCRILLAEML
jgi:hypothetical protein